MTVGIFGGRFDPIHNGHLAVAEEILKQKNPGEIWFLPDNQHQWRPIEASAIDRINMLNLAIGKNKRYKISDVGIKLGGMTETITVMRNLRKTQPENEYFFICGSDQLPTFPKWTHWKDLLEEVKFWVIIRKGYPIVNIPKNCEIIEDPNYTPLENSATEIRKRIKNKLLITNLTLKNVEKYIEKRNLYQEKL